MVVERTSSRIHWNYFLALEQDLESLSRFVDFAGNDTTYSLELARLLLGASAEVDVVLKQLCQTLDPGTDAASLSAYQPAVTASYPDFRDFEVTVPRFGLSLHPWTDWEEAKAPVWWSDHNKVKHSRHEYFERATLKNALNAMAGLYISVLHLYSKAAEEGELLHYPRLFNVSDDHFAGNRLWRFGTSFKYHLTKKKVDDDAHGEA